MTQNQDIPPIETPWVPPAPYFESELVGAGGQAQVFRARSTRGPSPVALKRYSSGIGGGAFYRELSLLLRVKHPHVVQVYDLMTTEAGEKILVLEYCAGGSLRGWLETEAAMKMPQVLDLGIQMGEALAALHRDGLIHGDVKPENIFRTRRSGPPVWKLGDFGVAHEPERLRRRCVSYTRAYAAPEQVAGQLLPASDIYAWGLVMDECLRDSPVEEDDSVTDLLERCLNSSPGSRPSANELVRIFNKIRSGNQIDRYLNDGESKAALRKQLL